MIKTRAYSPYINGRPRFTAKSPGVYVIMKRGRPYYVGFSGSNVYKTMYRHFQSWNDPRQVRVVYSKNSPDITARVIYTNTARQAANLERALIIKYSPKDNPQKLINYTTTPQEEKIYHEYEEIKAEPINRAEIAPF